MEHLFNINPNNCPFNCHLHTPKEAYFFIPKEEDCVIYNPSKPTQILRLIFEKVDKSTYLPHETQKFSEFMEYYNKNLKDTLIFPDYWKESETRKCLQASKYDIQKTIQKIKDEIEYKIPEIPYDTYEEIIHSGFLYMHGLDSHFRPIIITNAKAYMKLMDKYPLENFVKAIDVFMHYLYTHFFIPGQVENWVMIADLNNVSIWSPPLSMTKVFDFLNKKFLCRLSVLYVYGMNYILNMCWKVIKSVGLVDEGTSKKFNFISGQNDINNYVLKHINPSQLENRFGGFCDDIGEYLDFPFIIPNNNDILVEGHEDRMINEEEYINLVNNKKLVTISPYLNDKLNRANNNNNNNISVVKIGNIEFYECQSSIQEEENNQNSNNNYLNDVLNNNNELLVDLSNQKIEDLTIEEKSKGSTSINNTGSLYNNNNNNHPLLRNKQNKIKFKAKKSKLSTTNSKASESIIFETEKIKGGCCKNDCIIM